MAEIALEQWLNLLNAAVERCIARMEESSGREQPETPLENLVVPALREQGVTLEMYNNWLCGREFPHHKLFEELLKVFSANQSSNSQQMEALRRARQNAFDEKYPRRKKTLGPKNAKGHPAELAPLRRVDKESPVLQVLRIDQTETPYERMEPARWDRILYGSINADQSRNADSTRSAAEFIACYMQMNNRQTSHAAEQKTGMYAAMFRDWKNGATLPDAGSLAKLRECYFVDQMGNKDHSTADRFEALVTANRRIVLAQLLEEGEYLRFAMQFNRTQARFAWDELNNFLGSLAGGGSLQHTSLIVTHYIYLHFLRHGLAMTKEQVQEISGISTQSIADIESGAIHAFKKQTSDKTRGRITDTRQTYQDFLEGELKSRVKGLTPDQRTLPENALIIKCAELIVHPRVHDAIMRLPTLRRQISPSHLRTTEDKGYER